MEKAIESGFAHAENIVVIPNPIPEDFLLKERTHAIFNENLLVVGFCSFNVNNPYKGFELLKSALEIFTLKRPEIKVKLIIIGQGKPGKIPEKVEFESKSVNEDFELSREFARMNLLVVPSIADNSPSVIGESLMSGTPVIGSTAGGIPELIDNKVGGTFKTEDPLDLVAAIEKFYKPSNSKEISMLAESRFSDKAYVRTIMPIYKN
jgi:glycosyltransferase involved in cell wall biosynthesis